MSELAPGGSHEPALCPAARLEAAGAPTARSEASKPTAYDSVRAGLVCKYVFKELDTTSIFNFVCGCVRE